MTDLIVYSTEGFRSRITARAQEQPVWLTHLDIAGLFDAAKQNMSLRLKNIFEDDELAAASTVKQYTTVQAAGACNGADGQPQMEVNAYALYLEYDQRRKQQVAMQADRQDAALKAL